MRSTILVGIRYICIILDISFGDFCLYKIKDNSPWTIVQINLMRCAVPV